MAFAPDGRLVTASFVGTIQVWDSRTGQPLAGPLAIEDIEPKVSVSDTGLVAVGGWNGSVRLLDLDLKLVSHGPRQPRSPIQQLAFVDGGPLLSVGFDAQLLAWALPTRTGQPLQRPRRVAATNSAIASWPRPRRHHRGHG